MIDVWIPSSREREGNREHWERAARRRESIEESINSQSSNPCTREIRGPIDLQKIMFRKLCTQSISQNASPPTKFGIRNAPLSLFLSLYRPLSPSTDMCTYIYTLWESREFLEIVSRDLSANRTAIRSCHGCLFDSIRNSGKELWAKSIRIVDSSRLTHILPERKKKKRKGGATRRSCEYLLPRCANVFDSILASSILNPLFPLSSKEFWILEQSWWWVCGEFRLFY